MDNINNNELVLLNYRYSLILYLCRSEDLLKDISLVLDKNDNIAVFFFLDQMIGS